jgi:hypothetical protein
MGISVHDTTTIDLEETSLNLVDAAVAVTTGRLRLASPRDARRRLIARDPLTVTYFRSELARQIAVTLLWIDPHVQAVYEDQDVPPGEELAPPDQTLAEPLRLFVEVAFQTPALAAVVTALNQALGAVLSEMMPQPPDDFLDVTVVNDTNRRLLRPRAWGYRPAPALLARREDDGRLL